jgi:hypothetical protein
MSFRPRYRVSFRRRLSGGEISNHVALRGAEISRGVYSALDAGLEMTPRHTVVITPCHFDPAVAGEKSQQIRKDEIPRYHSE